MALHSQIPPRLTRHCHGRGPVTMSRRACSLSVKSGELLYGRKHAALEALKQSLRHQAFGGKLEEKPL